MSETDLIALYSQRLLALAADIPHQGRLSAPQGSAMRRSPACGSSITVDVAMEGGKVSAFAQHVQACALGQASASAFGRVVLGQSRAAIATAREELLAMLAGGPAPRAPFDGWEALIAARAYRNRHASILLVVDATLAAIDAIEA